jgi:D-threonate/D-erythronate kinase
LDLNTKPKRLPIGFMKIRVITDDFTSATDGLAAFADQAWQTQVCLANPATHAQVASTDTDSRSFSPELAQQAVKPWARGWADADILIKQFDSTLRGPVAAEVLAAMQASGRKKLLVAPAFPAAGRTTVQGRVLVNGQPVDQSSYARDPLHPVRESSVPALFQAVGLTVAVASTPDHAAQLLESCDAVVMDAQEEQQLQDIVAMAWARRELLWAGSTGLMRAMARALPPRTQALRAQVRTTRPAVVVGSFNPQSRQQLVFMQACAPTIRVFATPDQSGDSALLTAALVEQVCQALQADLCDGLVVTGGETAKQIARALNATGIRVLREVASGIPLCVLETPPGDIPLITKAGGFGDQDVFIRCLQALQGIAS